MKYLRVALEICVINDDKTALYILDFHDLRWIKDTIRIIPLVPLVLKVVD